MPITWRTWDRALDGALAGGITADAPTQALRAGLFDLMLAAWESDDFVRAGGWHCRDADSARWEIMWQRKDES